MGSLHSTHLVALLGALLALGVVTDDASACGGCFHLEQGTQGESSVVLSHRMAVAVSTDHTVLWDQIQFAGEPSDFAWVLPIKPGARLDLASDAFFETLDAATSTMVFSPEVHCPPDGGTFPGGSGPPGAFPEGDPSYYGVSEDESSGCCGSTMEAAGDGSGNTGNAGHSGGTGNSGGAGNAGNSGGTGPGPGLPPVEIVHEETVGPYETVTLSTDEAGALQDWLIDHGYVIDPSVEPIIDAYVTEGFDFIAMRLAPGADVRQMRPVRVISPGAEPTLPLRMVAAGTGAEVGLTLFVITEGRWEAADFPNQTIDPETIVWDVATDSSNYSALRAAALAEQGGRTWLSSYARAGALLSELPDPVTGITLQYQVPFSTPQVTIADAYFFAGILNGEAGPLDNGDGVVCSQTAAQHGNSFNRVVWACDNGTGTGGGGSGGVGGGGVGGGGSGGEMPCVDLEPGTIAAQDFICGGLEDLAISLVGLHPADVWLTRLEANLPRAALDIDFALEPSLDQTEIMNRIVAASAVGTPCDGALTPPVAKPPRPHRGGGLGDRARLALLSILGLGLLAMARRWSRPALAAARLR